MSRAALFDVDGVLIKDFAVLSLGHWLLSCGRLDPEQWSRVLEDYQTYQCLKLEMSSSSPHHPESHEALYCRFAASILNRFALALAGQARDKAFLSACREWAKDQPELYWYAEGLVRLFKKRGFTAVAISGSPEECLAPLAGRLGLDEFYGTAFSTADSRIYSGGVECNLALGQAKEKVIRGLAGRFCMAESYAFGDTGQDMPLLTAVGHPIALNPGPGLLQEAWQRKWPVLTAGDDVLKRTEEML